MRPIPSVHELLAEAAQTLDEIQRNKAVVLVRVSQQKQPASAKQDREVS